MQLTMRSLVAFCTVAMAGLLLVHMPTSVEAGMFRGVSTGVASDLHAPSDPSHPTADDAYYHSPAPTTFTQWHNERRYVLEHYIATADRLNMERAHAERAMAVGDHASLTRGIHSILAVVAAQANVVEVLTSFLMNRALVEELDDPRTLQAMTNNRSMRTAFSVQEIRGLRSKYLAQVRAWELRASDLEVRLLKSHYGKGSGVDDWIAAESFKSDVFVEQLRVGDYLIRRAKGVISAMLAVEQNAKMK